MKKYKELFSYLVVGALGVGIGATAWALNEKTKKVKQLGKNKKDKRDVKDSSISDAKETLGDIEVVVEDGYNDDEEFEDEENIKYAYDESEEDETPLGEAYVVYEFDNLEVMQEAINSDAFDIMAHYDFGDKGYLVVLVDGCEEDLDYYNGRLLFEDELPQFYKKISVDTMYFFFNDYDNAMLFLSVMTDYLKEFNAPMICYKNGYFINMASVDMKNFQLVRNVASEYLGFEIKDIYLAKMLKTLFDAIKTK